MAFSIIRDNCSHKNLPHLLRTLSKFTADKCTHRMKEVTHYRKDEGDSVHNPKKKICISTQISDWLKKTCDVCECWPWQKQKNFHTTDNKKKSISSIFP